MIIHSLLVSLLNSYDFVFLCFMLFPWCVSSNQTRFNYYNFLTAKNFAELFEGGQRISGVYTIYPDEKPPFDVYYDQTRAGGGWTVIQKRLNGFVDFNRSWVDYKDGFGNFLIREYWLGLEKIHLPDAKQDRKQTPRESGSKYEQNCSRWVQMVWCWEWDSWLQATHRRFFT